MLAAITAIASLLIFVSCTADGMEGTYNCFRIVDENLYEGTEISVKFEGGKVISSDGGVMAKYTVNGTSVTVEGTVYGKSDTFILVKKDNYWLGDGFLLCRAGECPKDFRACE